MADPTIDLAPVTLPDGRVVRIARTPGLVSQFADSDDPNMREWANMGQGGGGAPPADMTPGQSAVYGSLASPPAGPREHTPEPSRSRDPLAGAQFDDVGRYDESAEGVDVPDPDPNANKPRWIPGTEGGPEKAAWTVQKGANITGESIDAVEASYGAQQQVAQQQARDMQLKQDLQRNAAERAVLQQRDQIDQERTRRLAIDHQIQALDMRRDEAQQAAESKAVDPTRLIKKAPWVAMIAGLGMALQGAAQREAEIRAGQPFRPLDSQDWLKDAINADIEAQQIEYEQARDRATAANTRYGEMLELYGTPEAAKKALAAQDMGVAQRWLEIRAQGVADQQQLGALKAISADIETKKQQHILELRDAAADKVTEKWRQRPGTPGRYVGGAGGGDQNLGPDGKPRSASTTKAISEAAAKEEQASRALAYFEDLKRRGETTVPGYGPISYPLRKAATAVIGPAGQTSDQGEAYGHVQGIASGMRKPGDSSELDQQKLEQRAIGDGSVDHAIRAARQAAEAARRDREALERSK